MQYFKKGQAGPRVDEFAFVLLAGLVLIIMMAVAWSTMPVEQSPLVSPNSVSLSIPKGSSKSFVFTLEGNSTRIILEATGSVKDWIYFNKNYFALTTVTDITATIQVPTTAEERTYTGTIIVSSPGGNKTISVSIDVTARAVSDISRSIPLGDFFVSYTLGSESIITQDNIQAVKGYFADYPVNLVAAPIADDKFSILTSATLYFVVEETNSAGNLIIELNGQEIFNRVVGPQEISIPLDRSQIQKANTIIIKAGSPGWKFWMNTVYKIRSLKLTIDYQGISPRDVAFTLDTKDVINFKFGKLTFTISDYRTPLAPMTIRINDQTLFSGIPSIPSFSATFGSEISLNIGSNAISFSLDRDGFYSLFDVTLIVVRAF